MKNVLIVSKGIIWDKDKAIGLKLSMLNKFLSGDIVHSVSQRKFILEDWNGFKLCGCYAPIWAFIKLGPIYSAYFFVNILLRSIYRHHFKKKYDCIIARDPFLAGALALTLGRLCRIPFVVEMNGNYANPIAWNDGTGEKGERKRKIALWIIPAVLNRAAGIRILYPQQLDPYKPKLKLKNQHVSCFHEFTIISHAQRETPDKKYVLLIGAPALVKGCDLLIEAFNAIAPKFPDYQLKIVGWYQPNEKAMLEKLSKNNPQIQIIDPVSHDMAQRIISECSIFVLPSRTEGMGRVLLESMAHFKPVIGSNVEGIPHYVSHNVDGLLIPPDDAQALAEALSTLLSDENLRHSLGQAGHQKITQFYSEEKYAEKYNEMVCAVTK